MCSFTVHAMVNTNTGTCLSYDENVCEQRNKCIPKPYNYTPYNKFNFKTAIYGNCASFVCSLKVCKIIILGDVCVGKTSVLNR
jgi:hypothetical protein